MTIDLELTNHCNASCTFCPRDAMPQEGTMRPEVFEQALARVVEFDPIARRLPIEPVVVFCGTGEPLLNRRAPHYVERVRGNGFPCQVSTNGTLLTGERGRELLDAGVTQVNINVSEIDDEYERVYRLPFARTRDNIIGFVQRARGKCSVHVMVVDYLDDREHARSIIEYWRALGVEEFVCYDLINRGGSLRINQPWWHATRARRQAKADLRSRRANPICAAPFLHLFVGYDGHYYLCSSDWQKEVPFGSVFETSFAAITAEKLDCVVSREPICQRCSVDPLNQLTRQHAATERGAVAADPQTTLDRLVWTDHVGRVIATHVIGSERQRACLTAAPVASARPCTRRPAPRSADASS